jgi:glucose-1-phosphatase
MDRALLLDIGGVVIDLDYERAFRRWAMASTVSIEEIRTRFKANTALADYECGRISTNDFLDRLRMGLGGKLSDATLIEGWQDVLVAKRSEVTARLARLSAIMPIFAITNSNPLHNDLFSQRFSEVLRLFRQMFLSFEMRVRKPDAAAFEIVIEAARLNPERTLYIDDRSENVEAGRACGLRGIFTPSLASVLVELDKALAL